MPLEPIPVQVTRYRCPTCSRSHSSKSRARQHMGRCWFNPEAKGCKTCRHFDAVCDGYGDDCALGVSLEGRPQCGRCVGDGWVFDDLYQRITCPDCHGDGHEIKAGPIVGCEKWEAGEDR